MHCLNLKLTYDCNNRCAFCFSSYLRGKDISTAGLLDAVRRGRQQGALELVLSGGEPTLRAEKIRQLLTHAEELGYEKFIIQTNGSGLSTRNELLEFLSTFSTRNDIAISFSIHGADAETHDAASNRSGAFEELSRALDNVSMHTDCDIFTNTVVTRSNAHQLQSIVDLLVSYRPEIIQFAMMHAEGLDEIALGLLETARLVKRLVIDHAVLKTEGLPFCLMHGLEECVGESFWPETLDIVNRESNYIAAFDQLDGGMRWKATTCRDCLMDCLCPGIWKEHRTEFERAGLHPIN